MEECSSIGYFACNSRSCLFLDFSVVAAAVAAAYVVATLVAFSFRLSSNFVPRFVFGGFLAGLSATKCKSIRMRFYEFGTRLRAHFRAHFAVVVCVCLCVLVCACVFVCVSMSALVSIDIANWL